MSTSWKDLERTTAAILGGKRNIRMSYNEKKTDVDIPDFQSFKVDSKRYKKFRVYSLYEMVRAKYCEKPNDEAILVLRQHNKKTKLAVIDLHLLAKLMDFVREKGGQDVFS